MLEMSMKTILISLLVLGSLFVLFQSYTSKLSVKTEKQKYTLILAEKQFEIRFYPEATFAVITSGASSYKALAGSGFRRLANYIFGGNDKKEQIAMTTPVRMNFNEQGGKMQFVMPEKYDLKGLPKPNDANVKIEQSKSEYVAVIQFSGYANDEKIELYRNKLAAILKNKGIKPIGEFSFLGYNPPFQFVGRKNEIIIPIDYQSFK